MIFLLATSSIASAQSLGIPSSIRDFIPSSAASKICRRVEMCLAEWTDDFGDEFYEQILGNDFRSEEHTSELQSQ